VHVRRCDGLAHSDPVAALTEMLPDDTEVLEVFGAFRQSWGFCWHN
jgi:hypothetical protein